MLSLQTQARTWLEKGGHRRAPLSDRQFECLIQNWAEATTPEPEAKQANQTGVPMTTSDALKQTLISQVGCTRDMQPLNAADGLYFIAKAIDKLAEAVNRYADAVEKSRIKDTLS